MVFFTCNACGESIKKNQVEKHLNSCRNCQCLSCIDCGKDFWGDDYKNHLKCISEDQKYGGKGYAAKSNKGDVKQQQWIQRIHEAMNKPDITPKVRGILKEVSSYDNVPRKKARFQNWMKNSLKIFNTALHDQVWEIFSAATSNAPSQSELQPSTGGQPEEDHSKADTPVTEDETSAKEKKKNKRERKEERQKKSKKEKKQLKLESQEEDGENGKTKKHKAENGATEGDTENGERKGKKNKKKVASDEVMRENGNDDRHETMTSSKKCKKRKHESSEDNPKSKHMKVEIAEVECDSEHKGKFSWKGTIQAVLKQSPEDEISIKKLRKKVLAEYYSVNGEDNHKSEEKLLSLFNKKISSNPKFRVLKDKVKLVK